MNKKDVTCAIIVRDGKILVAARSEYVSNKGLWEFPGGKPKQMARSTRFKNWREVDCNIFDIVALPELSTMMRSETRSAGISFPHLTVCIR